MQYGQPLTSTPPPSCSNLPTGGGPAHHWADYSDTPVRHTRPGRPTRVAEVIHMSKK